MHTKASHVMLPGVGASVAGTKLALAWIIAGSQLGAPAPEAAAPVASASADGMCAAGHSPTMHGAWRGGTPKPISLARAASFHN